MKKSPLVQFVGRFWGCIALILLAVFSQQNALAFVFMDTRPGGRLIMNNNMPTNQQSFIGGTTSYYQVVNNAMAAWNQVGIGPDRDSSFFLLRSPTVNGDPCSVDQINEVRFASTNCGLSFGDALATTKTTSNSNTREVIEVEVLFNSNESFNVYSGPLRRNSSGSVSTYDLGRVAIHEMGHAAGLNHPDEAGQSVVAIMNAKASDTDRLQTDDINGARAINWRVSAVPGPQTLTVSKSGTGSGSVSSSPAGINCGSTCSASYTVNTSVTLTATPTAASTFSGWSGDCSGSGTGPATVQMSAARACTATFAATSSGSQTLTVHIIGNAPGTVTSTPAGINCGGVGGGTCSALFSLNTAVVLTPLPVSGARTVDWQRVEWQQGGCSGTGPTTVVMSADRTCIVGFSPISRNGPPSANLTVSKAGSGSGTVTSTPVGINCGNTCATIFPLNSLVGLTATPGSGSTFSGWSGDCTGIQQTTTLASFANNKHCTATFAASAVLTTLGSRATVSTSSTLYGGFALASMNTVTIAVRGASLQTLGVTQNPLSNIAVGIFDSAGRSILTTTDCPAANSTATYYRSVRGQALDTRDACITTTILGAGAYTFTITPGASLSDRDGEVLFEVTLGQVMTNGVIGTPQGANLTSIGSRGTVTSGSPLYGGFTLAASSPVMIAVRGASLQTLGITQNPLNSPAVRLFDASGRDILINTGGGVEVSGCLSTNTTAVYYATVRGQPLHGNDSCLTTRTLPAGSYTFTITPSTGSADKDGEVLFEVTLNPPN